MIIREKLTEADKKIIAYIFEQMGDQGGFIYPKEIAKALGIAHRDIIIPLRKIEIQGYIRTKITGMEGVFVDIIKDNVFNIIEIE